MGSVNGMVLMVRNVSSLELKDKINKELIFTLENSACRVSQMLVTNGISNT